MENCVKTYTYEEYNELEVELESLKMSHEKNFETYLEALTKINKLEIQSKKMLDALYNLLKWSAHFPPAMNDELEVANKLIKESTEI
jgi:hypothetical protein